MSVSGTDESFLLFRLGLCLDLRTRLPGGLVADLLVLLLSPLFQRGTYVGICEVRGLDPDKEIIDTGRLYVARIDVSRVGFQVGCQSVPDITAPKVKLLWCSLDQRMPERLTSGVHFL